MFGAKSSRPSVHRGVQLPALLALVPAVAVAQSRPAASDTARALQERYDRVKDFTADFTHTYEGGVLKRKSTERGTVQIKKPGRMRWERGNGRGSTS